MSGTYHYHYGAPEVPGCAFDGGILNELRGVAFDGYPILGSRDVNNKEVRNIHYSSSFLCVVWPTDT